MLYLSFVLATTITDHDDNWQRPNKNTTSTPTTHSTCQTSDSNNSSSSSGLRRDSSRAAGMFYFFIITLIFLGLLYALKQWWHSSSISNGGGSIGSSSGNDKGNSNGKGRRAQDTSCLEPLVFLIFIYSGQLCRSTTHHPFHTPMPVLLDNIANLESMLKFVLILTCNSYSCLEKSASYTIYAYIIYLFTWLLEMLKMCLKFCFLYLGITDCLLIDSLSKK